MMADVVHLWTDADVPGVECGLEVGDLLTTFAWAKVTCIECLRECARTHYLETKNLQSKIRNITGALLEDWGYRSKWMAEDERWSYEHGVASGLATAAKELRAKITAANAIDEAAATRDATADGEARDGD